MNHNYDNQIRRFQSLIAGVQKHLPKVPLTFASKAYTTSDVVDALQAVVDASQAATAAWAAWLDAVRKLRVAKATAKPIAAGVAQTAKTVFGDVTTLSDFGLSLRKQSPTVATKVVAVEKNLATRAARGTKGPKAKLKIKGKVPEVSTPANGTSQGSSSVSLKLG